MTEKVYEFKFDMPCEGCSNSAKKVLAKIQVDKVDAVVPGTVLKVTTDKSVEEILEALRKTGKDVQLIK